MKLDELIKDLQDMREKRGNVEVMVQEYGRKDAPRAFSPTEYATYVKVKPHKGNPGLYEATYNPRSTAKGACLIAYV